MDNQQLLQRIEALEKWKEERIRQQITFPFDEQSYKILNEYFMSILEQTEYSGGAGGNTFISLNGKQGKYNFSTGANTNILYTVNTSTDFFSLQSGFSFEDDTVVYLVTSGTVPNPLSLGVGYYVVNSTGASFQLSLTMGGSAINITDTGTGNQYFTLL
jgi:hypothetical protein